MLYLVDVSIYVFRAWQSLPATLTDTHGRQANALIGFADTLRQILDAAGEHPVVCAFDESRGQGERNLLYPAYKANRLPAPPELREQFQRCRQTAEALGCVCLASARVEADDIIGQLAALAQREGQPVTIVSADKDLAQFIGPGDVYWDLARGRRLDEAALQKRFRIRLTQMADLLALCGDKVDNIPGIPGVGQATAARLLKKWPDLDTLLAHTAEVANMGFRGAPRVSQLLHEHSDQVRLARQLTGLITDTDLPASLDNLARRPIEPDRTRQSLQALGFSAEQAMRLSPAQATPGN